MKIAPASFLLIALAQAGCKTHPPPDASATPTSPGASSSAAAKAETAQELTRKLGMASPGGSKLVDKRIEQIERNLALLPEKIDLWILLGRSWIQKARESADPGFYLNAGACADSVLDIDPGNALGLGLKAQTALNDHRFEDAIDLATKALVTDPTDLVALSVKSDALLEMGRFEEATDATQKMMDLKPNLASFTRTSYLRWLKGDQEGAKAAAKQALGSGTSTREPEPHAWAMVQAAMLFWHVGDYDGADAGFDKALGEVSDYPPALVGKGRVALAKGQGAKAAEYLDKAYKESPLVETAWLLGDARAMAGDAAGAKAAHDLVLSRGKRSDPRTLALFLATKNRDPDEAVQLARHERKTRGDLYTEDALGWALLRAGKLDEAREHLTVANRLGTRDATLLFHLGALKLAAGDAAGGQKLLKQALALNPKFDVSGAEEAAKLLAGSKH
jgi:tetratricopeptide (TPR) repeat protein